MSIKKSNIILPAVVALMIIILDQAFQHWVILHISLGSNIVVIPHILSLTNIRNNGAAWSILQGKMLFFLIITIIAIIILIYLYFKKNSSLLYHFSIALIFAGAIGNFIDRLSMGYVVDMFQLTFINFPIFNIADISLTIGVILIIIYEIWFIENDN